jgi:hypothetical protein
VIAQSSFAPSSPRWPSAWFQRIIAVYCLLFGVLYWIRLIGVYDGPLWRFDLMPVHWQSPRGAGGLYPFAGIGLWMLTSWGPVIWFICAATEITMYARLSRNFSAQGPFIVILASLRRLLYSHSGW